MCEALLLSVEDAARLLGFGRSFVYRQFIQTGVLPSLKVGGARRIAASDLHLFVERLKAESLENE